MSTFFIHRNVVFCLYISGNVHYIRLRNANKAEPTLPWNPRGDITRNSEHGWVPVAPKIGHVNVSDKKKLQQQQTTKKCSILLTPVCFGLELLFFL